MSSLGRRATRTQDRREPSDFSRDGDRRPRGRGRDRDERRDDGEQDSNSRSRSRSHSRSLSRSPSRRERPETSRVSSATVQSAASSAIDSALDITAAVHVDEVRYSSAPHFSILGLVSPQVTVTGCHVRLRGRPHGLDGDEVTASDLADSLLAGVKLCYSQAAVSVLESALRTGPSAFSLRGKKVDDCVAVDAVQNLLFGVHIEDQCLEQLAQEVGSKFEPIGETRVPSQPAHGSTSVGGQSIGDWTPRLCVGASRKLLPALQVHFPDNTVPALLEDCVLPERLQESSRIHLMSSLSTRQCRKKSDMTFCADRDYHELHCALLKTRTVVKFPLGSEPGLELVVGAEPSQEFALSLGVDANAHLFRAWVVDPKLEEDWMSARDVGGNFHRACQSTNSYSEAWDSLNNRAKLNLVLDIDDTLLRRKAYITKVTMVTTFPLKPRDSLGERVASHLNSGISIDMGDGSIVDLAPGIIPMLKRLGDFFFISLCSAGSEKHVLEMYDVMRLVMGPRYEGLIWHFSSFHYEAHNSSKGKGRECKALRNHFPCPDEQLNRIRTSTVIVDDSPLAWIEEDQNSVPILQTVVVEGSVPMTERLEGVLKGIYHEFESQMRAKGAASVKHFADRISSKIVASTPPASPQHQ